MRFVNNIVQTKLKPVKLAAFLIRKSALSVSDLFIDFLPVHVHTHTKWQHRALHVFVGVYYPDFPSMVIGYFQVR